MDFVRVFNGFAIGNDILVCDLTVYLFIPGRGKRYAWQTPFHE